MPPVLRRRRLICERAWSRGMRRSERRAFERVAQNQPAISAATHAKISAILPQVASCDMRVARCAPMSPTPVMRRWRSSRSMYARAASSSWRRARRVAHCARCPSTAISNLIENVLRHRAARVGVVLSVVDGRYRIEVMDDGPGDPATMQPGRGLAVTRAVADAIGAEFTRSDPPPSANRIVGAGARTQVCASTLP